MGQKRLSSLNILSIENETDIALRHDINAVIKILAEAKVWCKTF